MGLIGKEECFDLMLLITRYSSGFSWIDCATPNYYPIDDVVKDLAASAVNDESNIEIVLPQMQEIHF